MVLRQDERRAPASGGDRLELVRDRVTIRLDVDTRASRVDAASYRVREPSEVIALNTTQAYLDVLRNNEIVDLGRDNVEVHEQIKGDVARLVDDGAKGIGDLQQAEARVASAKDSLIRAEKDRDDAVANYIRIVGEEPRDLIRPELPDEAVPPSVEAAVVQSLNNNPAVRAVAAEIDVAHGERRVVEGDFYPTMSLEVAGSANDNLDGVRGPNHDFTALLRFELNIFKGGIDEARRMEAVERIGEARAECEQVLLNGIERRHKIVPNANRPRRSKAGIQLVHLAVRIDAGVGL